MAWLRHRRCFQSKPELFKIRNAIAEVCRAFVALCRKLDWLSQASVGDQGRADIIAFAGVIEAQKAAPHCSDNLPLSADNPALGVRRGKIGDRQRAAIGAQDVTQAGTKNFGFGLSALTPTV